MWTRRRRAERGPRLAAVRPIVDRQLDTLAGVGRTIRGRLAKLGLRTVRDLIEHAPFRYVGARPISTLFEDAEEVSIEATVGRVTTRRPRRRLSIVEAAVADESGQVRATWFNQPWVAEQLEPGSRVRLIGTLRRGTFAVRAHEPVSAHADLVPVYPAGEEVTPKKLRELVLEALPRDVPDPLPSALKERSRLPLQGRCVARAAPPALRSTRPSSGARGSRSRSCSSSSSASRVPRGRTR